MTKRVIADQGGSFSPLSPLNLQAASVPCTSGKTRKPQTGDVDTILAFNPLVELCTVIKHSHNLALAWVHQAQFTAPSSTLAFPDAGVSFLFPPTPFPIQGGIGGLVLLGCIGILRGWRYGRTPLPTWFFPDFADDSAR